MPETEKIVIAMFTKNYFKAAIFIWLECGWIKCHLSK